MPQDNTTTRPPHLAAATSRPWRLAATHRARLLLLGAVALLGCSDPAGGDAASADAATGQTRQPDASDATSDTGTSSDTDATSGTNTTPDADTTDAPHTVLLPIEVLGAPGTIEAVTLSAHTASADGDALWLHTHRLAWREDGEFARRDAPRGNVRPGSKGSARLNGGPWVPLTNETVTCEAHEAALGCLNGGYQAVRLRVPITSLGTPGLKVGDNSLELRFDETDGVSSGWRVLALDVHDAAGTSRLSTVFTQDDPDGWRPPRDTPEDIAAGAQLWSDAALTDIGFAGEVHPIRAKCASCHFSDGYDLAYFNYSNRAIVARSTFHGLSEAQGEQIASYIRSLPLALPEGFTHADAGRPWDPPYQPGPGLDARPVALWAAGAGLDAVLERDVEMKPYLFPNGVYEPSRLAASGFLNPRETPQALQYPDWSAWLPTIAPEDLVTDPSRLATEGAMPKLAAAQAFLQAHRAEMDTDAGVAALGAFTVRQFFEARTREGEGFPGLPFYTDRDVPEPARTLALSLQQTRQNLAYTAWFNLRQLELLHRYDLEGWTHRGHAAGSPPVPAGYRSWGQTLRVVFETAPHFVADHAGLTFNQTQPGNYLSTAWYSMEQVINSGYHAGSFGIDWNYHPGHIMNVHHGATGLYDDGPIHAYRLAWALFGLYQGVPLMDTRMDPPTPFTPRSFGFPQRQLGLGLDIIYGSDTLEARGELTHADRAQLQEALALAFLEVVERYSPDDWIRREVDDDAHRSAETFETAAYAPSYHPDLTYDLPERGYQADAYYLRIKLLKDGQLVTPGTLSRLVDWGEGVWPLGAWGELRP